MDHKKEQIILDEKAAIEQDIAMFTLHYNGEMISVLGHFCRDNKLGHIQLWEESYPYIFKALVIKYVDYIANRLKDAVENDRMDLVNWFIEKFPVFKTRVEIPNAPSFNC